ncbi:hypothetical protein EVAR_70370_1 [Eumeta japonica]|uniref:Uncharacterized protein n=1 Tax=Eumeta variegata TaxID=151549 RepID=A0A4C1SI78_EUMVA|nr:hypothetical protein EVAR_70370_1 [Eumeta japonica]
MGGKNSNSNPKKAKPQSVNDYRRISIRNAGYRIYTSCLLKLLDNEIAAMEGIGLDPDHVRIDERVFNLSQRKPHAPCVGQHIKLSIVDVVTALVTLVFNRPQSALGQRGRPKVQLRQSEIKKSRENMA